MARPSVQPHLADRRSAWLTGVRAWAEARRGPDVVFAALALVAFVTLLYLGRSLTFFGDEWEFIVRRQDLTLATLLDPHNEHWSLFLVLVYNVIFSVVGLHSYLPYLAALLLVHVLAVTGLFVLLRRIAGPFVALGGAALMLFLGSAYEDLLWAFQIGFVGSVAAGVWALLIIHAGVDRRALMAAGGLLLVAVATSGLGLFFLVAAGTLALLDPSRRRALRPIVAVGVIYVAWFAIFGRAGLDAAHSPFSLTALAGVPAFVITGGGRGIGALIGADLAENQALFVLLMTAVAWGLIRGQYVPPLATAAMAGLVVQFVIIGLARDQAYGQGSIGATAPRYVYSTVAFLLIVVASLVGDAARRSVSWRQGLAVLLVVGFALIGNVAALRSGSHFFEAQAVQLRAAIGWVEEHPSSPLIRANVAPTSYTPVGVSDILALAGHGSVTHDDLLQVVIPHVTPAASDQAIFAMVKSDFQIGPAVSPVVALLPPKMTANHDVTADAQGGCLSLRAIGAAPQVSVTASAGTSLLYVPTATGRLKATLSLLAGPQDPDSITVAVTAGLGYAIALPDVGAQAPWTLSLVPPVDPMGGQVCSLVSAGP